MFDSLSRRSRTSTSSIRRSLSRNCSPRNAAVSLARLRRLTESRSMNTFSSRLVTRCASSADGPAWETTKVSGSPRATSVFVGRETAVRARMLAIVSSSPSPVRSPSSRATWAMTGRLSSSCEMARARSAGSVCADLARSAETDGDATTIVASASYSRGSSQTSSRPTTAPAASGSSSDHRRRRATANGSKTGSSCVVFTGMPSLCRSPWPGRRPACAARCRRPRSRPVRRAGRTPRPAAGV